MGKENLLFVLGTRHRTLLPQPKLFLIALYMRIFLHHYEGWKRSGLRLSRTLISAGVCIGMGIGLVHCGWGSDTASTSTKTSLKSNKKSVQAASTQARVGKTGGGAPIRSLLPEQADEPISPDGRTLGATPGTKGALVGGIHQERALALNTPDGQAIDRRGREIEEVEALADLRQELAEDIQEERRVEKERIAAAQLALGNHDQDAERAGLLEAAGLELDGMGEIGAIEEGYDAELDAELSSDFASPDTDAQGRDIEEVEALADLRQEIAADIAAEDNAEAEDQQAFDYELVLGDNDQDSGLEPSDERQQETQEYEPESQLLESAVGADFGGDSDS